jgi:hypothetical protein
VVFNAALRRLTTIQQNYLQTSLYGKYIFRTILQEELGRMTSDIKESCEIITFRFRNLNPIVQW